MIRWTCPHCATTLKMPDSMPAPWRCTCGREYTSSDDPGAPVKRTKCIHLGEPTGDYVSCSTCGGGTGKLPIYSCAIEGTCTIRKPVIVPAATPWDGAVCTTCELRDLGRS